MKKIIIVMAILLCSVGTVLAETYQWEDEEGIHFSDNPPPKSKAKVKKREDLSERQLDMNNRSDRVKAYIKAKAIFIGMDKEDAIASLGYAKQNCDTRSSGRTCQLVFENTSEYHYVYTDENDKVRSWQSR